ncbi:MAG: hypothetical protein R3345_08300, partial [Fulvivirga sp.]|nr:hypothetical protein [Fulvivirga sp.]
MKNNKEIRKLIEIYNRGEASKLEIEQIELYLEDGSVLMEDLTDLKVFKDKLQQLTVPEPSSEMSDGFYEKLEKSGLHEQQKADLVGWWASIWTLRPSLQWAYTLILLAVGVGLGYFLKPESNTDAQLKNLSAQVTTMKEMMMLNLLEEESTSDRLKAVNLTSEMPEVSRKVTNALLKTLNNDENVNVRLATIEALYPYAEDPQVRQGLIA